MRSSSQGDETQHYLYFAAVPSLRLAASKMSIRQTGQLYATNRHSGKRFRLSEKRRHSFDHSEAMILFRFLICCKSMNVEVLFLISASVIMLLCNLLRELRTFRNSG